MNKIKPLDLTPNANVNKLIEQRRGFNFNMCELNIYETRQRVLNFPLSFNGFTITSMLRGSKRVRFNDLISRDYNPGNTIIAPAHEKLEIDFPEASFTNPTQCSALTLDDNFVKKQINEFNESLDGGTFIKNWQLFDNAWLCNNNEDFVNIKKKITRIAASKNPLNNLHLSILLKELLLCVLKMQNISELRKDAKFNTNNSPFSAVINFIQQNIYKEINITDLLKISTMSKSSFYRAFAEELGISPYQLIIDERLKISKKLLLEEKLSIKETAYASGFSSSNYFIRLFKKNEGLTPKQFMTSKLVHPK
ncbi:AraC family transcriptional regulator [Polaribacter sp. Hel1_33_96]|uniref:helix-turn-helix domain-containing protein n=1 Tax=Polaribacter sp. Hel1_33_96 TaxID=1336805 RepID=UPI000C712BD2|nr:helix-turn-helix domain-containing protein [Polaribacter sp. Hel1_33_96]PKV64075.1 AraC family transcriptional regulator [Polaribacter sp. Hel1_33_96]